MEHPRRFQVEPPRRVLVVGNRGSGRGRLASLLAQRFGLPLIEIEAQQDGFTKSEDPGRWRSHVAGLASAPEWVMTGNDITTFDLRVPRADWFIWVDLPISSCVVAVVRRVLRLRAARKQDVNAGVPTWPRFRDIFSFPTEVAPRIMGTIERERRNRTIFILRSRAEVAQFVARLPGAGGFGDHLASDRPPSA